MSAQSIMSKYRRALRNGTGMTLSHEQVRELGEYGVLKLLAQIEVEELCPANDQSIKSANTGSASAGTGSRPTSGKLPATARNPAPLSIEALSEGL